MRSPPPGDGARFGGLLLRIDQTNVPLAGSNKVGKPPCGSVFSVTVAVLVLTGCNANQAINPSSQPPSQVFAGRYVDYNPYNPISYAQNNTGRGAGGSSGR